MNLEEESANYVIIDNFLEHFELSREDILEARNEGEYLAYHALRPELVDTRQDMITWLLGMTEEGEDMPYLRKIATSVSKFKSELNDVSQLGEGGDRSLRVDSENF